MTNKEAYMVYCSDEGKCLLSLGRYSIDLNGVEDNQVAGALGMLDSVEISDYTQGGTREALSDKTRAYLITKAKAILQENGIVYKDDKEGTIKGSGW